MASFKDQNGREWLLALDGPKIREVRKELNIDLAAFDGSAMQKLSDDVVLLVDTLWVLVRGQAGARNVTDVQFGESLVCDALERATDALTDAITDFFPTRKKELLRTLATKTKKMQELGTAKAMAAMEQAETTILEAMDRRIQAELTNLLTRFGSVTTSPESSESAPTG